jgi:hypothetical protein
MSFTKIIDRGEEDIRKRGRGGREEGFRGGGRGGGREGVERGGAGCRKKMK